MGNDKLVLADSTEITLVSSQGINALHVNVESKAAVCILWENFTKENLAHVAIKNAANETTGNYTDMVLDHMIGQEESDGTILVTFSLRSKTTEEILLEKVAQLENGQQTQDDAINDLGQAVSDVVEGGSR